MINPLNNLTCPYCGIKNKFSSDGEVKCECCNKEFIVVKSIKYSTYVKEEIYNFSKNIRRYKCSCSVQGPNKASCCKSKNYNIPFSYYYCNCECHSVYQNLWCENCSKTCPCKFYSFLGAESKWVCLECKGELND